MKTDPASATYGSLAANVYRSFVGAAESINADAIAYVRSLVDVVSKPYSSYRVNELAKEQIARSAALLGATLDVIDANNAHVASLARELASAVSTAHENYVASLRDVGVTREAPRAYPLPSVN